MNSSKLMKIRPIWYFGHICYFGHISFPFRLLFFLFIRCRRDSVWSKIIYVYILWSVHGGKHLLKKTDCSSCWSSVSHLRLFNYNHSIISLLNIKTLNFKHSMIISTQIIIIWYDNQVRKKQVAKNCVAKT